MRSSFELTTSPLGRVPDAARIPSPPTPGWTPRDSMVQKILMVGLPSRLPTESGEKPVHVPRRTAAQVDATRFHMRLVRA
ncbi:hypothetical protein VTN77DRAFT_3980 [Rasamsonia byssochlamydoides]|uniref:uncharacterized protein n=1 Tax=Rasamsonia byssochlamydoides TaxID=89139 RepID=UPI00374279F3